MNEILGSLGKNQDLSLSPPLLPRFETMNKNSWFDAQQQQEQHLMGSREEARWGWKDEDPVPAISEGKRKRSTSGISDTSSDISGISDTSSDISSISASSNSGLAFKPSRDQVAQLERLDPWSRALQEAEMKKAWELAWERQATDPLTRQAAQAAEWGSESSSSRGSYTAATRSTPSTHQSPVRDEEQLALLAMPMDGIADGVPGAVLHGEPVLAASTGGKGTQKAPISKMIATTLTVGGGVLYCTSYGVGCPDLSDIKGPL